MELRAFKTRPAQEQRLPRQGQSHSKHPCFHNPCEHHHHFPSVEKSPWTTATQAVVDGDRQETKKGQQAISTR